MADRYLLESGAPDGYLLEDGTGVYLLNAGDFTPAYLLGPSGCWYDFSDLTTLYQTGTRASPGAAVTADGDPVGLVLDKSGKNNDLVQATSTKRPLYKTGPSRLLFDGVDDFLASAAAFDLSNTPGQIGAALAFQPTGIATQVVCELGTDSNSIAGTFYLAAANDPAIGKIDCAINGNGTADGVGTTSTSYGGGVISTISYQSLDITNASAAARAIMRRNGAVETTAVTQDGGGAGTAFSATQTLYVGARAGTSLFFSGSLYGIFIVGRGLQSGEISDLDTWMVAKTVTGGAYTLAVAAGTFALAGQAMTPAVGMPAATGAFVLTGAAMTPKITMPSATGAFALNGSAAAFPLTRRLTAVSGAFVLTGQAIAPRITMPAGVGAFSLTGQLTGLLAARKLTAGTGAFTLSGTAITPAIGMPAATGVFTLTGAAITPRVSMPAAAGAFVINGTSAGLLKGSLLTAAPGAFAVNGSATGLFAARNLTAAPGAFVLTGQAAALRNGRTLTGATGAFALSGSAINLPVARRLTAATGAYALSGQAAVLARGRRFIAATGAFAVNGAATSFPLARRLTVAPGVFALSGSPAGLALGLKMAAGAGHYVFSGRPVVMHIAALPFFPDNVPALAVLGVPPPIAFAGVTAVGSPGVLALTSPAAVSAPSAFVRTPAPLPVNLEE